MRHWPPGAARSRCRECERHRHGRAGAHHPEQDRALIERHRRSPGLRHSEGTPPGAALQACAMRKGGAGVVPGSNTPAADAARSRTCPARQRCPRPPSSSALSARAASASATSAPSASPPAPGSPADRNRSGSWPEGILDMHRKEPAGTASIASKLRVSPAEPRRPGDETLGRARDPGLLPGAMASRAASALSRALTSMNARTSPLRADDVDLAQACSLHRPERKARN